ncbi:AraC family transcriptional regulator ligand-binding domain-containing protein [Marinobacter lacisalsi]|uniref:AraC family transcriptional regulator ligand-binding domain-containing protein n=1 Tax=Marinobacter lacisalsi TaxID=475979 RepID=A0ABV8QKV5_9GAMM
MTSSGEAPRFYTAEDRVLAAHHQVALLIELAMSRNIAEDRLLRNTGLFPSDIRNASQKLSASAFRRLITNVSGMDSSSALNLLWGSQLFPGHYGSPSTLLAHSGNLMAFLETLVRFRFFLCPFMAPNLVKDDQWTYLYWTDAGGLGKAKPFVVTALMSGVRSASNWLAGRTLPWQIYLKQPQPKNTSEYLVAFGETLRFSAGIDLMRIESRALFEPWKNVSELVRASVLSESAELLNNAQPAHGLPELVYRVILSDPANFRSLSVVSDYLGTSPATLKRRLKECETSYQIIYDEARLHLSLYQFYVKGWSHDEVAKWLECCDSANFRRMFKRWTGLTPTEYRSRFRFGTTQ